MFPPDCWNPKVFRLSSIARAAALACGLGSGHPGVWALPSSLAPTSLPTQGAVIAGAAALQPVAAGGANLVITQTSPRAIITWGSFNIGSQASVTFQQPDANAVTLNRVIGSGGSQIDGRMQANGQVFLINPNGILFSASAQVNAHGLLASSLDILDADFNAGRLHAQDTLGSNQAASVSNAGTLITDSASGNYVVLLGGQTSNSGQIQANNGTAALISGSDITLNIGSTGLIQAVINAGALEALTDNSGTLQADNGLIQLRAAAAPSSLALTSAFVNTHGVIQARGLSATSDGTLELSADVVQASGSIDVSGLHGGKVLVQAGRSIIQDGLIDAHGTVGQGGTVQLDATSSAILQTLSSQINADGPAGGGSITFSGSALADIAGNNHAAGGTLTNKLSAINHRSLDWVLSQPTTLADGSTLYPLAQDSLGADAGGAVLQLDPQGHLSSVFYGLHPKDHVGSGGITPLSGPNTSTSTSTNAFVIASPDWSGGLGAVTWVGSSGAQAITADHALIGAQSGDRVGSGGVVALTHGNYVVSSPDWGPAYEGAVTWGNGATGLVGTVSSTNSLVGEIAGDRVGKGGVIALTNGNYLVVSPDWGTNYQGAVTWGSGAGGLVGLISSSNSLVGGNLDRLGSRGVIALVNGNYVISSPEWGPNYEGAVTWGNGATGLVGTVSSANSLIGSISNDKVGSGGVIALANGDYVVASPDWGPNYEGAITWGNGATGLAGTVSSSNSLTGAPSDHLGSGGLTRLSAPNNNAFVIASPEWSNGLGAVTWIGPQSTRINAIDASNSLIGSQAGDRVGSGGVVALTHGNYVVSSPDWGPASEGAATWGNGATGLVGTVSSTNSMVGAIPGDRVSSGGVHALAQGNYVVSSPEWGANYEGAVTWGNGATGSVGPISSANSLIGNSFEQLGHSVWPLADGSYLVIGQGGSNLQCFGDRGCIGVMLPSNRSFTMNASTHSSSADPSSTVIDDHSSTGSTEASTSGSATSAAAHTAPPPVPQAPKQPITATLDSPHPISQPRSSTSLPVISADMTAVLKQVESTNAAGISIAPNLAHPETNTAVPLSSKTAGADKPSTLSSLKSFANTMSHQEKVAAAGLAAAVGVTAAGAGLLGSGAAVATNSLISVLGKNVLIRSVRFVLKQGVQRLAKMLLSPSNPIHHVINPAGLALGYLRPRALALWRRWRGL
ncbi:filamentous hemagglutinin family N-terminal domain protein [Leptothrix ochracea L12]|uniref:Filamentous hemagglutinin family N-terminal domain protein n=1 Tax=Leptothrix ochracea L12 TaxID=735332 RepID=I4Z524_9BURK|nr:filamentous hemagglutinin N-terminal domain-containing protein [Leptothrix ochracea]EIM31316.1 filamentous hemagglutinin family N-terminal domain protein [Leptothrix ochracea L12]